MKTILVVEDEKEIRETLAEMLSLAGYDVLLAKNGKEGYGIILQDQPDLVLCDVNMSELDGFELLGAINQKLVDAEVPPFIFLTAKVEPNDIRNGMRLGADDYILKPFDHLHVLEVVKLRLEKRDKLKRLSGGNIVVGKETVNTFSKLPIPCEEGLVLLPYEDIVRCEAERAYCNFYLNNGTKILVSKSMKEFESLLLSHNFVKVHKSTIVNMKYANRYIRGKGGQLVMSDGSLVHVAVRKKEALMEVLKRG